MAKRVLTESMIPQDLPSDVEISAVPRPPFTDPTMGIPVVMAATGKPRNSLVAIGDSLTHGFQSGAVFNTALSYPAIVAWELGWDDYFRQPRYDGLGGLPLNIEWILRELESHIGDDLSWWETPLAAFRVRTLMDQVEDWWERGPGSRLPRRQGIHHNLAVYGWDLRDTLERNGDTLRRSLEAPSDGFFGQFIENHNERAALRVLDSARDGDRALTPLEAAQKLGAEGTVEGNADGDGIETLVIMLGNNNVLPLVTRLKLLWSDAGYNHLERKSAYTVWRPTHFRAELLSVAKQAAAVRARHVIWATVPHVTIAPLARGVGDKIAPGSRYFPFYTRPWIRDPDFNALDDPHFTEAEARATDSAIDQYNQAIADTVSEARHQGKDWYLLDLCGMLDRLAARRYIEDPAARPEWWTPYELPPALQSLDPVPSTRFLAGGPAGRTQGGLFSLDGVHPTTVGYGLIAQEVINIMQLAGVKFYWGDGKTERTGPIQVDFRRLIGLDTLITSPPRSIASHLGVIGWLDQKLDIFRRLLNPFRVPG